MEVENVSGDDIVCIANGMNGNDSGEHKTAAAGGTPPNDGMKKPAPVGDGSTGKRRGIKKVVRQNSREVLPNVNALNIFIAPQRRWKNSRRSRNGYGRGLPKKGGGGGKGVWGLPGSELIEEDTEVVDRNDPNYDNEVIDGNVELKEVIVEPTPEEFFKSVEPVLLEYFENGDTHEVAVSLDEIISSSSLRPLVTSVSLQIALDHKDCQREMVSVLISDLYGRVVTAKDISKGRHIVFLHILLYYYKINLIDI